MSLAQKAVRGAVFTIITSWLARILGVIGTLWLTRYISPTEMGEFETASLLTLTAGQMTVIGFGQYIVVKKDLDSRAMFQITAFSSTIAAVVLALVVVFATPLGNIFNSPRCGEYVPGLAASVFLARIGFVPERVLLRDMKFGFVGIGRTIGELGYSVTAVALAIAGLGGHAIVIGNVVRSVIKLVMFAWKVPRKEWCEFSPIDKARIRDVIRFGTPLWISTTASFISRTWDNLLFAHLFGAGTMGLYKQAYNLADIPTVQVGESIGDVLLPSFTKVSDTAHRQKSMVRATGLLALVVFPLAVGLGAVAEPLVGTLLDEKWQGMAPFLTILAVLSVVRPVGWNVAAYLQAQSHNRMIMMLEVSRAIAVLSCIAALGWAGPKIAAIGVGVGFGLHALFSLWALQSIEGLPMVRMLRVMMGPLIACGFMAVAVWITRHFLTASLIDPVALLLETTIGAITYVIGVFVFARHTVKDCLNLLKETFLKKRGKRAAA